MTDGPTRRLVAAGRWCFGDRQGLVLWLGLVCWFGLTWRVGFFITDTYAMANTLVAMTNGQLHVSELRYSITFGSQPGLYEYAGRAYGRNYGMLVLAVPLVWALEGLARVVAPRLLLAGLWAGLALALVTQLAELDRFDRERTRAVGSLVVTLLFVASVLTATDLPPAQIALVALQLSTLLVAATAGLVLYRLVSLLHGRPEGLAAGVGLGVATPIGFWATLPKRHTLVATLVLGVVYAFAMSRHREGEAAFRARAGAYALAGYITWIHAFEALFVVVALGIVDLLTARETGLRQLAVLGAVLLVASTPMLATNYAITGNPATPPRMLPGVDTEFSPSPETGDSAGPSTPDSPAPTPAPAGTSGTPTAGGPNTTTPEGTTPTPPPGGQPPDTGGGSDSPPSPLDVVRSIVGTVSTFAGQNLAKGLGSLTQPEQLRQTFVRSGTIPALSRGINDYEPIDLAVLEAMPLLAGLAAIPLLGARRLRNLADRRLEVLDPREWHPTRQTDLLVIALATLLTLAYLRRLPTRSMLTVRYLHPVIALGSYGVCRVPAVRAGLARSRWLAASSLVALPVALVVLTGGVVGLELAVGEAIQYNALWNLFGATVCAVTVVAWTFSERVPDRAVSVALSLPAGFTAGYLLLSALVYFRYGTYAFDLVALVADVLPSL